MGPHHTLALKAVGYGADKIPDKAFEKIPVAGPRLFREKDGGEDDRRNNNDNDNSSSESSDGNRSPRDRPRRRPRRRREKSYDDRGYESDRGPKSNVPYFQPPPTVPVDRQAPNMANPYATYNPADYATQDAFRSGYSPSPNQAPSGVSNQPTPPPQSSSGVDNSQHRSSIADRYRPPGFSEGYTAPEDIYQLRGVSPQQQPSPVYPTYQPPNTNALTLRPPEADYSPYPDQSMPPYDYADVDGSRRGRRRNDSKSDSRDSNHSRNRSRKSKIQDELKQHKDLGISALGALAGGIVGSGISKHHSKMGMVVGAAIGGIGANAIEKRHEKGRKKDELVRHRDYDYGYDSY